VDMELKNRDEVLRELKDNLRRSQQIMEHYYNKKHRPLEFNVGEQVWLKPHGPQFAGLTGTKYSKLHPRYFGPFKIKSKIGELAYELDLPPEVQLHPVFHASRLKACVGEKAGTANEREQLQETRIVAENPTPVAILDKRRNGKKMEALVHWKNHSPADSTWESIEDLQERF
ncbi:hypothetical protein M569_06362, partial [Genlisea aurea]